MKVITMESSAYKEMMAQIANIAGYIREARDEKKRKRETEDKLLDTAQAAKMLNVSKRTMQRCAPTTVSSMWWYAEAAATAFPRYCGYWRTTQ